MKLIWIERQIKSRLKLNVKIFIIKIFILLSACTTVPTELFFAEIELQSTKNTKVKTITEMGGMVSGEFEGEGYEIRFVSNREINSDLAKSYPQSGLGTIEFYSCSEGSSNLNKHKKPYRPYQSFSKSLVEYIEPTTDGRFLYSATLRQTSLKVYNPPRRPICAQLFIVDGSKEQIYRSNEIVLNLSP